ncbi:hypothetical protein Tco_0932908 [Tanacetum coccineum]
MPWGRRVEFEEVLNRDGSRAERESDWRRPSERMVEDGGSYKGNLPPLIAAHLGRSENGQPFQSTLTSGYGGDQPLINQGGNLPSNGVYSTFDWGLDDAPSNSSKASPSSHSGSTPEDT